MALITRCFTKTSGVAPKPRNQRSKTVLGKPKLFTARRAFALLPDLHRHTQGKPFRPQAFRTCLSQKLNSKEWQLPTLAEAYRLLKCMARRRNNGSDMEGPIGTWKAHGIRYVDKDGSSGVSNLQGFETKPCGGASNGITWREHGFMYRVHKAVPSSKGTFQVTCTGAFKRVRCIASKENIILPTSDKRIEFKNAVVFNPRRDSLSCVVPQWTLIYLHSFSQQSKGYMDYPHYFCISNAAIRVVLPTAPVEEQSCFRDWMVYRGKRLGWRRIKFSSWFNYLTDTGGTRENDIDLESLLHMRAQLHCLIRTEVQRLGGDAKRVIVGGMSQGCCVALDAALTYPEELGGVIGVVGHVLGSTPLDPAKRSMPLHLYHETSDREMRWEWVKTTVQRLVQAGFNVSLRRERDPAGCGHWIQDIEGTWIRDALRKIVLQRDS